MPPKAWTCWRTMDVEARYCASHGGIRRRFPLAGGDINVVERWELADGTTCVRKKPRTPVTGIYDAERESLNELAKGPLRVPVVFEVGPNWILMEDLGDGEPHVNLWAELGRGLAYLHQVTNDRFGFEQDNFLGLTRQPNPWTDDGHTFFADHRLRYQADLARDSGKLPQFEHYRIHALADRLKDLIPTQPASLCHGDLWTGNIHVCANGQPALIDPATHYGWGEADLAMTTLFGKLPEPVYAAYCEVRPLADGWWDRLPIYNLYHLLNHLNLFGMGYLSQIRTVLDRF